MPKSQSRDPIGPSAIEEAAQDLKKVA